MKQQSGPVRTVRGADPLVAWLEAPGAPERVSLGATLSAMGGMGFGRLLLLLTLPNVTVVPSIPPLPLLCGIPALLICLQMVMGQSRARLPGWAERLSVGRAAALRMARFAAVLGRVARPGRWNWMAGSIARPALGLLVMALTVVICLPLLGLNLLPAVGLLVLCVGLAEDDGAVAAAGVTLSLLGTAAMVGAIWLALLVASGALGAEPTPGALALAEALGRIFP